MVKLRMTWVGPVARMGQNINAYRIFLGKPEGKRWLGRLGLRSMMMMMNGSQRSVT
jgi:hypothetical protein